jgi:hypothetical protein
MNQRRGAYPPEFRQQMVALVRLGRKPSDLAPRLNAKSLRNCANNCGKSLWGVTSWQRLRPGLPTKTAA